MIISWTLIGDKTIHYFLSTQVLSSHKICMCIWFCTLERQTFQAIEILLSIVNFPNQVSKFWLLRLATPNNSSCAELPINSVSHLENVPQLCVFNKPTTRKENYKNTWEINYLGYAKNMARQCVVIP